jgi:hypothetical protein
MLRSLIGQLVTVSSRGQGSIREEPRPRGGAFAERRLSASTKSALTGKAATASRRSAHWSGPTSRLPRRAHVAPLAVPEAVLARLGKLLTPWRNFVAYPCQPSTSEVVHAVVRFSASPFRGA